MGSTMFSGDKCDCANASSDFTSEHASRNSIRSKGVRAAFDTP